MVSNIKYPNFKKVGIPKAAIWVIPIVVAIAIVIALSFPGTTSKFIFVPLVIYALYGLKKNVDTLFRSRRRRKPSEDSDTASHDI
jgi:CDP-diacylglycerol--serine O-phosphatidyltransferase